MSHARIAILLSVYNGERYLSEQIESILRQSFRDFTLYIRDDGSSDGSVEIIRSYSEKDSRIRFIEDGQKLGYPACFHALTNRDLPEDYIMFSDQDDIWLEDKIAFMLEKMAPYDNEIAAYYAGYTICDASCNPTGHSPSRSGPFTLRNTLFEVCGLEFTMAINKNALRFLQQHMPRSSNSRGTWMSPMYAAFGHIIYDNRYVALYRRHDTAVTSDNMSFFGLWLWRLRHFFGGGFSSYRSMLTDFYNVFGSLCTESDRRFLRTFASKHYFPAVLKKVFYPGRLRSRWADELGLRAAFLLGKL